MQDVLDEADRLVLIELASTTLLQSLKHHPDDTTWVRDLDLSWVPTRLTRPGASFVTLERDGRLLGCIGTLRAYQPLALDVVTHTLDAAYRDPRFSGITSDDVHALDIEISLLGDMQPCEAQGFAELQRALRPYIDGVFIRSQLRRGTLLPSVWDDLPDPNQFIEALWRKAGIPPGVWPDDLEVSTYEVEKIVGKGPR